MIKFNEDQLQAINLSVSFIDTDWESFVKYYDIYQSDNKVGTIYKKNWFTIRGAGGVGKTTVSKEIVKRCKRKYGINAATLSHAAKEVLASKLDGVISVKTLAQLIGIKPVYYKDGTMEFKRDKAEKLKKIPLRKAKLLIIDEGSMLSEYLVNIIDSEKLPECKVLVLMDEKQLPPVDDEAESPCTSFIGYELTKVERYKGEIYDICTQCRNQIAAMEANPNHKPDMDFISEFIYNNEREKVRPLIGRDALVDLAIDKIQHNDDVNNFRVIAYRRKTVKEINSEIRRNLFPGVDTPYRQGDWLVVDNTYTEGIHGEEVYNGQFFVVREVSENVLTRYGIKTWNIKVNIPTERLKKKPQFRLTPYYLLRVVQDVDKEKQDFVRNGLLKLAQARDIETFTGLTERFAKKFDELYGDGNFNLVPELEFMDFKKAFRLRWPAYYGFIESFAQIDYAYCMTAYKAQGQTINNVVVVESDIIGTTMINDKRKLQALYVAMSRASENSYIYNK